MKELLLANRIMAYFAPNRKDDVVLITRTVGKEYDYEARCHITYVGYNLYIKVGCIVINKDFLRWKDVRDYANRILKNKLYARAKCPDTVDELIRGWK